MLPVEELTRRAKKRVGKEESASMALGDQIGEASGTITGTRVITPSAGQTRIERWPSRAAARFWGRT